MIALIILSVALTGALVYVLFRLSDVKTEYVCLLQADEIVRTYAEELEKEVEELRNWKMEYIKKEVESEKTYDEVVESVEE